MAGLEYAHNLAEAPDGAKMHLSEVVLAALRCV
jgi:hypothetical protein